MIPTEEISDFSLGRNPRILFGAGSLAQLADEAVLLGRNALLVSGSKSLEQAGHIQRLSKDFEDAGLSWRQIRIPGEPTVDMIDTAVAEHHGQDIDLVIGIGGGSALDAAKAIAGLLPSGDSVMDYLEGVGAGKTYSGPALPWIAVPTTAGTGSEATRNAVISRHGPEGFKKSFRDEQLIAQLALVDPDLLIGCPLPQLAANGMDALTQLLESYVSTRANPVTRALAWSGMTHFRDGFARLWDSASADPAGRAHTALASLLSGICLANTGLGAVHGLASPLGAIRPIPHGVACGTLLSETVAQNIAALKHRQADSPALADFAALGELLCQRSIPDPEQARQALLEQLRAWTEAWQLPRLGTFGLLAEEIDRVVAGARGSSMQTNPVVLSDAELAQILRQRL